MPLRYQMTGTPLNKELRDYVEEQILQSKPSLVPTLQRLYLVYKAAHMNAGLRRQNFVNSNQAGSWR